MLGKAIPTQPNYHAKTTNKNKGKKTKISPDLNTLTKAYPLFPVCSRSLSVNKVQLQNIEENKINDTQKQARTVKQYGQA